MKVYTNLYEQITSVENLFTAWAEFHHDKQQRGDVMAFEWRLEENIFALHRELKTEQYKHGPYHAFYVHDPKQRLIHKAIVRDRILHHSVFAALNPIFEPSFISHSYSCRVGKGTHCGVVASSSMLRAVSQNNTKSCFALKCDVRRFFASVNQDTLLDILQQRIDDEPTMRLLRQIVYSFDKGIAPRTGVPIGNLTSQLFANVYMNEFDQFVKHQLRVKNYVRYTDDFVIVAEDQKYLDGLIAPIGRFLKNSLSLELHPNKISIRKFDQGIDFLGYIILPHYTLPRTKTKNRMFRKLEQRIKQYHDGIIDEHSFNQVVQSYLGVLSHADSFEVSKKLKNSVFLKKIQYSHKNPPYKNGRVFEKLFLFKQLFWSCVKRGHPWRQQCGPILGWQRSPHWCFVYHLRHQF